MTDTEYSVQVFSAIWPTRGNRTMAEVTQKNVELVGMPTWTEEEHNLAKALQRNLKGKERRAAQRDLAAARIAPGRVV
jgi:aminobenzoyl-glutamate utilization protein B